jgi:hypothetical protein
MTLSALRLYSVDNRLINESGAVVGMRTGKGKNPPVPFCPP